MSSPKPPVDASELHKIPINDRPPGGGPLFSKIFFPLAFDCGIIGTNLIQFCALPLLLIPFVGRGMFEAVIDWTKDSFGRLLILITVLFAPTSLHITTDSPSLSHLIERDASGRMTHINLPDRLVIMSNHQAYTDWMYMWILACYAGHAEGLTILLKWSLRHVPVVGWGMRFFRFIFLRRSWAADKENLTRAITRLGRQARASDEKAPSRSTSKSGSRGEKEEEHTSLLHSKARSGRSPLWLLIFPEGTITSDDERAKSIKYANKEGIDDLSVALHPRSTGLLFCLRTLLPEVPDLQLLDVTIGYPGVPLGKYPQDYYGMVSVFFRSVPPPRVHIHLRLHSDLSSIPSLTSPSPSSTSPTTEPKSSNSSSNGVASPEEAKAFELWLREIWKEKDERLKKFVNDQKFDGIAEIVPVRQIKWYHWPAAFGAGGIGSLIVAGKALVRMIRS